MNTPTHGSSAARRAEGDAATASGARWRAPAPTTHQSSGATFRNVLLAENRRRSDEYAAKDMSDTLRQETLDALRQKARDLQHDKWMYEDVHM